MRLSAALVFWLALFTLLSSLSRAQDGNQAERGATASGLCGLFQTGAPRCAEGLTLSGSGGYGVTEMQGRHDRLLGGLGVAVVPLSWLALSLELAGRVDRHPPDAQGDNVTAAGDPWLRGRVGFPLASEGRGLSLGGELGLWLPGQDAPSFQADAISVEAKALVGFQARRWQALGNVGFRLDQSHNSAPDRTRLRRGDRIALGLSDAHALLLGVGLAHFLTPQLTLFGELSANLLFGNDAPQLLASPMRLAIGARYFISPALQVELTLVPALSQRPVIGASDPLVPIEPRFSVVFGVRYAFLKGKPTQKPKPKPLVAPPVEQPQLASLSGQLTDQAGNPLPDATVKLLQAADSYETITDQAGQFGFARLLPGKVELHADAAGFESGSWQLELGKGDTKLPTRALAPGASTGVLRCLVRTFESDTLKASITIRDAQGKRIATGSTDPDGTLEFKLTPGDYRVMIEATGYRSQRTTVRVAANEVAILNVDLRDTR